MSNMSYCRFQNTLEDLEDCREAIYDIEDLSPSEKIARAKLIEVCKDIIADTKDNQGSNQENILPTHAPSPLEFVVGLFIQYPSAPTNSKC